MTVIGVKKATQSRVAIVYTHMLTVECFRPMFSRVLYTAKVANQ